MLFLALLLLGRRTWWFDGVTITNPWEHTTIMAAANTTTTNLEKSSGIFFLLLRCLFVCLFVCTDSTVVGSCGTANILRHAMGPWHGRCGVKCHRIFDFRDIFPVVEEDWEGLSVIRSPSTSVPPSTVTPNMADRRCWHLAGGLLWRGGSSGLRGFIFWLHVMMSYVQVRTGQLGGFGCTTENVQ